jgi:hypothetical protein
LKKKVEVIKLGREIWLSPLIQATWEARAVGRLEGLDLFRTYGWLSGAAL